MKVWQKIATAALLIILLPIFGIMLHNINQYEQSAKCNSIYTMSRSCITYIPVTIAKDQRKKDVSSYCNSNCYSHNEYVITAKTQTGKEVTVSVGKSREDLRIGDSAEIISWNGSYIGVSGHNKSSYDYGWHPHLAKNVLEISIFLLAILALVLLWDILESVNHQTLAKVIIKVQNLMQHVSRAAIIIWLATTYLTLLFTLALGLFMRLLV